MSCRRTQAGLDAIRRVYSVWGHHPRMYAAQDWITFLGRPHAIRHRAVDATGIGPGARVLEVGCGTGRNFRYIVERIGSRGQLVGFDYSHEMLEAARAHVERCGWRNVELVEGDAAVLNVEEGHFDAVLAVLAFSAIPDHVAALERCRDVLRPGGVLAVCDARPFEGALSFLNPLVRTVYTRGAAWNPDRNIPLDMMRVFGNVAVETLNLGTFFVATTIRRPPPPGS